MKRILFLLLIQSVAWADGISQPHIQLELILPEATLQPGHPTQVGVRMDLEAGWHLYWKNPGDSGKAPTVKWELPSGIAAGPWIWPVPKRIPFGRLVNYGYERRLLLVSPLTVPVEGLANEVTLGAHVEWLICSEECIPGKLDLRLKVPVKATPPEPSVHREIFHNAAEALPNDLPDGWRLEGLLDSREVQLQMSGFPIVGEKLFFPDEPRIIQNAAPQKLSRKGDVLILSLKRSEQSSSEIPRLSGVLVTGSKGYLIDVPLKPKPNTLSPWMAWGVGGLLVAIVGIFLFMKSPRQRPSGPRRIRKLARYLGTVSGKTS